MDKLSGEYSIEIMAFSRCT